MSLLDDLEDDYHALLLEKGNLLPKKPPPLDSAYVSQGYVARVQENRCVCGAVHRVLYGVFLRKVSRLGTTIDIAIPPKVLPSVTIPLDSPLEVVPFPVLLCPSCLPSKGFKEIPHG